jgi:hypothetical protein
VAGLNLVDGGPGQAGPFGQLDLSEAGRLPERPDAVADRPQLDRRHRRWSESRFGIHAISLAGLRLPVNRVGKILSGKTSRAIDNLKEPGYTAGVGMNDTPNRRRTMTTTKRDLGGFRTVVLTNGREYVEQANTTFGIVRFGTKSAAARMFLKDAADVIKDINKYGAHQVWAEVVEN